MIAFDERYKLIAKAKICPYCDGIPVLRDSKIIYGPKSNFGNLWICPKCFAYVGCHAGTNKPFGRLADEELRRWKNKAHDSFDKLWKYKIKVKILFYRSARTDSYKWLSESLGIPKEFTHIGMFDVETCKKVIELCNTEFRKVYANTRN